MNNALFTPGHYEKIGYDLFCAHPDYRAKYNGLSNAYQISFILGLIKDFTFSNGKPIDTVLEVGVHNGVTSLYMLKTGSMRSAFNLFGIEKEDTDTIGHAVMNESTENELSHYHLFRNSTCFDIEEIMAGKKIDLVFHDGGHIHPSPIIDLIFLIPFLHDESIVLFHDVVDHLIPNAWGESFVYCSWDGSKYRTVFLDNKQEASGETTLGCIKIPTDKEMLYSNIERVARIPFRAAPRNLDDNYLGFYEQHFNDLHTFMLKHYSVEFSNKIYDIFMANLKEYTDNKILYMHETKFFRFLFEQQRQQQQKISELERKVDELKRDLATVTKSSEKYRRTYNKHLKSLSANKDDKLSYKNGIDDRFMAFINYWALVKAEEEIEDDRKSNSLGRWIYWSEVANILRQSGSVGSVIELGPGRHTIVKGSDVILHPDLSDSGHPEFLPVNDIGKIFYHDATATPWPIADKAYDMFIALQVWEHLNPSQVMAFKEVMRISRRAILSFPYQWSTDDEGHQMIDWDKIAEWTCNIEPKKKSIIAEGEDDPHKRLICLWEF